jgi:ribosomal protein S18 acetylase RimI-like enzyme
MQKLFVAQHHPEAHFVCGLLEADGIAAEVRGETLFTTIGGSAVIPGTSPEVWLADTGQLPQALEVIRRFVKGEAPATQGGAWTCPGCGEAHEAQFTACWYCGGARPAAAAATREAGPADVPEIVRVTNAAYVVEQFCIQGQRTDAGDVLSRLGSGCFLVVEEPAAPGRLRGSVHLAIAGGRGHLGMLAVDPCHQGTGLARALVAAVEARCRQAGCTRLDLSVVNLREELFPFYARLGFEVAGTLPFPQPQKVLRPLHLVALTKAL